MCQKHHPKFYHSVHFLPSPLKILKLASFFWMRQFSLGSTRVVCFCFEVLDDLDDPLATAATLLTGSVRVRLGTFGLCWDNSRILRACRRSPSLMRHTSFKKSLSTLKWLASVLTIFSRCLRTNVVAIGLKLISCMPLDNSKFEYILVK